MFVRSLGDFVLGYGGKKYMLYSKVGEGIFCIFAGEFNQIR